MSRARRRPSTFGIEFVYQDLALCNNLDIVKNMFLGRERRRGLFLDDEVDGGSAARETLAGLNVTTISSIRQQVSCSRAGSVSRWRSPNR